MRLDPSTEAVTLLSDPELDRPGNRFNDGKCDPWGRFWAGTMAYDFEPLAGSLWRLDGDGRITRQRSQLTISNGLAWSQDRGTLYFIDSPTLNVVAFPLTSAGEIAGEPTPASRSQKSGMPYRMACASMRRECFGSPCLAVDA